MKPFVFVIAGVALFASNPRFGDHPNGQIYAISCTARVAASVGSKGIGYAYFDPSNRFSGIALQGFGC